MKPFSELAIGDRFQIGTGRGLMPTKFIKTSEVGYGLNRGVELWPIKAASMPCEPVVPAGGKKGLTGGNRGNGDQTSV